MLRSSTLGPRITLWGSVVTVPHAPSRRVRPCDDLADVPDPPRLELHDGLGEAIGAPSPRVDGVRCDAENVADLGRSCEKLRLLHAVTVATPSEPAGERCGVSLPREPSEISYSRRVQLALITTRGD